jgi:choline dehydrogenase-like flavoprotein
MARMAARDGWLDDRRARTLAALCDTFVASVRPPDVEADDPTGFWARTASDLGAPAAVARRLGVVATDEDRDGIGRLLDLLRLAGLTRLPQGAREGLVKALGAASADALAAFDALRALTMLEVYGRGTPGVANPMWAQLGYDGPPPAPPVERTGITPLAPPTDGLADGWELTCDVVVVGSGSGGGVIAGELAAAGRDVVVLEAGGHVEEDGFAPDELTALETTYWRGGVQLTDDGNVAVLAGATLGGGSTINWQNCVAPPAHVRQEWADEHGLKDLATDAFDAHLDAVRERIGATDACSDMNPSNAALRRAAEAHGWGWTTAQRNADPSTYSPDTAGHTGYGDRSGSKQGTLRTYLADAARAGGRIVTGCTVRAVTVRHGRATGVVGTWRSAGGREVEVTVQARHVVLAAGALETPAILLRSRLGGQAVGHHLRLHPVPIVSGFHDGPQRAWWGAPQTCIVTEFASRYEGGHGFLLETPHWHPGLSAATFPWRSARDHKLLMGRFAEVTTFIAVTRERGAGRVTLDDAGQALVTHPLDDPLDQRMLRDAVALMLRAHVAAGARTVVDLHPDRTVWRRGDDVEAAADRMATRTIGAGGRVMFSAHQMGSARLGDDAATSVGTPEGHLHDVANVWIGDTSAFPTAVGSNPMLTCMALARRTAHALLAAD